MASYTSIATTVEPKTELTDASSEPLVYVIILNWNGWHDTVECLDSLLKADYRNLVPVIIDNGSTNDSIPRLREWVENLAPGARTVTLTQIDGQDAVQLAKEAVAPVERSLSDPANIVLMELHENLGFAKATNRGIVFAMARHAPYIWLLNNDTVVEQGALRELVGFLKSNRLYDGVTAEIHYYDRPGVVWNCGGKLTWFGSRKYYLAGRHHSEVPQDQVFPVTFVTACALLLRTTLLDEIGLLTERFFFGEEDIELSRRIRKSGKHLACRTGAIVYHKVGSSVQIYAQSASTGNIGRIYLHYLNRFIHLRTEWPRPSWKIWRLLSAAYILPMLNIRYRIPWPNLIKMYRRLLQESSQFECVDKRAFDRAMELTIESLE